ncbi:hypothetical protein JCM11491_004672 [Sporobolomyces phaffii]
MLQRFDASSRYKSTIALFQSTKKALGFPWGYRAEVYAAACVYVAVRQNEREIWIQDIMDCCESIKEPVHLSRAIRLVKLEHKIHTTDLDPILFVERVLVHLQKVLRADKPTYHAMPTRTTAATATATIKTKPFSQKNLEWIGGIALEHARTVALALLAFSRALCLVHGRAPEQVACAAVVVALEAVARRACPKTQEFDDEMAWLTHTAAFTIQEREREYTAALAAYAPKLPWVAADRAKKWKRGEVVQHTRDILQFWKALDTKERNDKAAKDKAKEEEDERRARVAADVTATEGDDHDHDGNNHAVFDAQEGEQDGGAFGLEDGDEGEEDDGYSTEGAASLPGDLGFADPLVADTDLYAFSPEPEHQPQHAGAGAAGSLSRGKRQKSNQEIAAKRPGAYIRGATEWNRNRAAQEAIARGFGPGLPPPPRRPAPPLLDGYSSDGVAPDHHHLPSPSPPLGPVPLVAVSESPDPTAADPGIVAQLQAYGSKPDAIRAQLAPGFEPAAPYKRPSERGGAAASRLDRLLWTKAADDIDDDELFDDGELESYLRTEAETEFVRRLPQYADMVRVAARHAERPQEPARPRRRVRGQPNPEFAQLQAEARAQGVGLTSVLKARRKRERGESDLVGGGGEGGRGFPDEAQNEFRPRKKKSKVNAEARARLAALLAQGSDDEDHGDGANGDAAAQAQGGTDEWVRAAMNAAGQVDSGVVHVDGAMIEDEGADDGYDEADDWRKEFQYGAVDSDGYDDE